VTNLQSDIKNTPLYILVLSVGAFLLPFIYSDSILHKSNLSKYLFVTLTAVLASTAWLFSTYKSKKVKVNYSLSFFLLIIIFLFAASSIFWTQFKGTYNLEIIQFASLILISFTSLQIKKIQNIKFILFSAVIGGALTSLVAFIQAWGWNPLAYNIFSFPAASFINKNHLANYLDLLVPISLFLLVASKQSKLKWVSAISLSFLFSYLVFSHNRASWISLLIISALILFFSHKNTWLQKDFKKVEAKYLILTTLLSCALIFSPNSTSINEENRFKGLYNSLKNAETVSSTTERLNAYYNAIEMIKDKPLIGSGLGSFQIAFQPYRYNIEKKKYVTSNFVQLHNDPLQIFVELGLIGGFLSILFILLIIFKSYQYIITYTSKDEGTYKHLIQLSILLATISSTIHSFLSFPLHLPASSFLLFLFFGFIIQPSSFNSIINVKKRIFFTSIILIFIFLAGNFYFLYTKSSFYTNKAIHTIFYYHPKERYKPLSEPINKLSCKEAKKYTDKALKTYSNDFYIQGWAYIIYLQCTKNQNEHLKLAHKILASNPYHISALENAAAIFFNKNNYSSAKPYYLLLHYLYPLNSGYPLLIGHIAVKQKDYITAHKFYLKTLQISPQNSVAQNMINKLISKGYLRREQITP